MATYGEGLYLLVQPTGQKLWRLKYRFGPRKDGKPGKAEKLLALGVYPDVSLKRVCEKRNDARTLLADGIDPGAQRKADDQTERVAHLHTVEAVARAWLDKHRLTWTESHATRTRSRFEKHVFPWIGQKAIRDNVALRRPGHDIDTITAQGFRSMASTLLNKQQWHKDAIERQLAHGERNNAWQLSLCRASTGAPEDAARMGGLSCWTA